MNSLINTALVIDDTLLAKIGSEGKEVVYVKIDKE